MKHIIGAALLLSLALPAQQAPGQQILNFTNTSGAAMGTYDPITHTFSGGAPYEGFNFAFGIFGPGALIGFGDAVSLGLLMHSATPFLFNSADFSSLLGVNNLICVAGFTSTVHPGLLPGCSSGGVAPYFMTFFASPGVANNVKFNWAGVTDLVFDSHGGIDPEDGSTQFQFTVDNVSVSTIPEPTTFGLLLTGLVGCGVLGYRRRKR